MLRQLLTEDANNRVSAALSHGDFNPRNVLVIDSQLYLIDYARTGPGQPAFSDAAWLETCLMRDTIALQLDWVATVRLQRLLGVASMALDCATDALNGVFEELLATEEPVIRAAFRVLWTIRQTARQSYPPQGRQPWWRDYLTQLTIAAVRTLKFPENDQNEARIRASWSSPASLQNASVPIPSATGQRPKCWSWSRTSHGHYQHQRATRSSQQSCSPTW